MRLHPDKKLAGVLCPVFAVRTETDLGVGDTAGVRQMIDWCHAHGLGVLQLLPINETSDDNSPYNAISSLALEPGTIAVTPDELPELTPAAYAARVTPAVLAELQQGAVDYRKVKPLKRALLEEAFRAFRAKTTARTRKFREFLKTNAGWLDDYTLFRALMDVHGGSPNWESWPAEHRTPRAAQAWLRALPEERQAEMETRREFFGYVQWIAFDQWTTIKQQGSRQRVALMGDIPFGVSRYSADVWANRELFDLDWSGGAPPEKVFQVDPFTEKWGQNWGIPLYRWDVMRARGFDWWRRRVGIVQRLFHIYRIDHVLGFYRIYAFPWPPQRNGEFEKLTESDAAEKTGGRLPRFFPEPDTTEKQQAINRAQGDELLRMVQAASGDTVVIAEDLGLVPPYVRPHLLELGIPGFKIPHWERTPDYTYVEGAEYPRLSVCTPATHDHEPVAAMWRQMWRAHEEAIAQRHDHQAYVTWLELQRLCWWIGLDGQHIPREFTAKIHACYCRTVLACNAWLALFLITDIFAEKTRFNLPGSVGASNWSARLGTTVAGLDHDPQLRAKTQMFEQLVRSNQRLP